MIENILFFPAVSENAANVANKHYDNITTYVFMVSVLSLLLVFLHPSQ